MTEPQLACCRLHGGGGGGHRRSKDQALYPESHLLPLSYQAPANVDPRSFWSEAARTQGPAGSCIYFISDPASRPAKILPRDLLDSSTAFPTDPSRTSPPDIRGDVWGEGFWGELAVPAPGSVTDGSYWLETANCYCVCLRHGPQGALFPEFGWELTQLVLFSDFGTLHRHSCTHTFVSLKTQHLILLRFLLFLLPTLIAHDFFFFILCLGPHCFFLRLAE